MSYYPNGFENLKQIVLFFGTFFIFPLPILLFLPNDLSARGFDVLLVFDSFATLFVVWRFGGGPPRHGKRPPRHDDGGRHGHGNRHGHGD